LRDVEGAFVKIIQLPKKGISHFLKSLKYLVEKLIEIEIMTRTKAPEIIGRS
jgi:hypothetical protein